MGYNLGDRIRCEGEVSQADVGNIDPTTVKAWHCNPNGTVTTLTYGVDAAIIKSAVGVYYFDLDADIAGEWFYGFYSTGTGKAASSDTRIMVRGSKRA